MRRFPTLGILVLIALAALLAACGQADPTPTPTATPTPATPTPAAGAERTWERIQASGTLVVGTSADYPPFESYNANFQLDGFDIALMKALGQKLGVEVEFNDFAFDGLLDALQTGQADIAISAIAATEERRERVDFSDVYFISHGVALANAVAPFDTLPSLDDLRGQRVAVEGGTVFESWAESNLVEPGIIPQADLHVYSDVEQAIKDVQRGLVDVVLLDLQPAQVFVRQGGVKIVGEDVALERFAIALPKGQDGLRRAVNQALQQAQSENLIFTLAEQYLDAQPQDIVAVPTPTPEPATPTPAPNATPTAVPTLPPPAGCIDGMAWVADLNYDDSNMTAPPIIPPGQPFVKSWRVRNSGTCTWDSSYALAYDHGNVPAAQMGGQPVRVQGTVAPGATYDFSANLTAPALPGGYQGFWQMRNGQGRAFGETVWVGIRVPAPAQPTPAPTQTPVPGITFTANTTNIQQGQCVTISWNAVNVKEVYYYQQGQNWQDHGVAGQASHQECPQQTTTYYLRVVMPDGSVQTRDLTIYVTPVANAPQILSFTANPQGQIQAGQCVTLQWNVTGNISDVLLSRNNATVWDGAPYQGSYQDCPPGAGQMTYVLRVTGPGGNSQASQNVNVVSVQPTATPAPQPTATPVPQPPVIDAFSVDPGQITQGECVNIHWSFSGSGLVAAQLFRNGDVIGADLAPSGIQQDCPPFAGNVEYRIQVDSEFAGSAQRSQVVTVAEARPPEQPPQITSFFADPPQINLPNTCTTLSWSYSGTSIASVSLTRSDQNGNRVVLSEGDATSPYQDCVDASLMGQTLIYELTVSSEFAGSDQQQLSVPFPNG
jgi:polar amino acid transport system substrate-binding protein